VWVKKLLHITVWPYPTAIPIGWLAWSRPVICGCFFVGDSQLFIDFAMYLALFLASKAKSLPHPAGNVPFPIFAMFVWRSSCPKLVGRLPGWRVG